MSAKVLVLEDHIHAGSDPLLEKALNDADSAVKKAENDAIAHVQRFVDQKKAVEQSIELCRTFKRIDMSFLQMAKNGLPVFAIMPMEQYRAGGSVWWDLNGYHLSKRYAGTEPGLWKELFQGVVFRERIKQSDPRDPLDGYRWYVQGGAVVTDSSSLVDRRTGRPMEHKHTAMRKIPETVEAFVEKHAKKFDKFWVAEEASWHPEPKDPLVIGQKGQFFYLLAQFDATKIESYVRAEFGG